MFVFCLKLIGVRSNPIMDDAVSDLKKKKRSALLTQLMEILISNSSQ